MGKKRRGGYIVLWEFRVRSGKEEEFERRYGPKGDWVSLFAREEGYIGTRLFRDRMIRGRYLTLDEWASPAIYRVFRERRGWEYEALDRRCQTLTEKETLLGGFRVPGIGFRLA